MNKIIFERKKDLLFRTIDIVIDQYSFKLKRGERKEIELFQGTYELIVKIDWCYSSSKLNINSPKKVIINQSLPNWYYFIGGGGCLLLAILCLFNVIPISILDVWLIFYFTPLCYTLIIKRKKYFKINITD